MVWPTDWLTKPWLAGAAPSPSEAACVVSTGALSRCMPDTSHSLDSAHHSNARDEIAGNSPLEIDLLTYPAIPPKPNHFEKLPPELWTHVASCLHPIDKACLALTAKMANNNLGSCWTKMAPYDRHAFLRRLDSLMPGHRLCFYCAKFHKRSLHMEATKLNRHSDPCATAIAPHCQPLPGLSPLIAHHLPGNVMALMGGPGLALRAVVTLFAEPALDYKQRQQPQLCDCLFDLSEKATRNSHKLVPYDILNQRIVQLVVRAHRYGPSFGLPLSVLWAETNSDYRYGHWRVKSSARVISERLYLKIVCVRPVRNFAPAKWFRKAPERDKCSTNLDKGLPLCCHGPIGHSDQHSERSHKVSNALLTAFARCRKLDAFEARILDFGIAFDCKRCHSDYLVDMIKEGDVASVRVTRWTCLGDGVSPTEPYWYHAVTRESGSGSGRSSLSSLEAVRSRGEARKLFEAAEETES